MERAAEGASAPRAGCAILGSMKTILLALGLLGLTLVTGCVNQSIAARRSDIPWNQPMRSEATPGLPSSVLDQYD